jgi:hypothetical protein
MDDGVAMAAFGSSFGRKSFFFWQRHNVMFRFTIHANANPSFFYWFVD